MRRKSDKIAVDLEVYSIYIHQPSDTVLAIDKDNTSAINAAVAQYEDISNVPDAVIVEGITLDVVDSVKGYELTTTTRQYKVKELYPPFIRC